MVEKSITNILVWVIHKIKIYSFLNNKNAEGEISPSAVLIYFALKASLSALLVIFQWEAFHAGASSENKIA